MGRSLNFVSLFACFLCKLPLILRVVWILKTWAGDIYKGTQDIEFEQDWSVGLVATYAMDRKWNTIFLVSGIFPGIADCVIMLGVECIINLLNLMKSLVPFLRKWKF